MNKHFKRALIGATTLLAAAMLVGCSSKSSGGEDMLGFQCQQSQLNVGLLTELIWLNS